MRRYYLERSPDCPTGKQEVDEDTYLFMKDIEILDRRARSGDTPAIAQARAEEVSQYRKTHNATDQLGALGCKTMIAEGLCPFWTFDQVTNLYVTKR